MATGFALIIDGIAEALRDIDGLRVYDVQPDSFSVPAAIVNIDQVNYHGAFQMGLIEASYKVFVIAARADTRLAVEALDAFLAPTGPQSVREAIERDVTLGGRVASIYVTSASAFQTITLGDVTYLGIEFTVETKST